MFFFGWIRFMPTESHRNESSLQEPSSAAKAEVPFLTQSAFLEQYAKNDPSHDPEMIGVIIDAIKSDQALRSYFFRVGPHIGWVPILWDKGFLTTPPIPGKSDQGYVLPRW